MALWHWLQLPRPVRASLWLTVMWAVALAVGWACGCGRGRSLSWVPWSQGCPALCCQSPGESVGVGAAPETGALRCSSLAHRQAAPEPCPGEGLLDERGQRLVGMGLRPSAAEFGDRNRRAGVLWRDREPSEVQVSDKPLAGLHLEVTWRGFGGFWGSVGWSRGLCVKPRGQGGSAVVPR